MKKIVLWLLLAFLIGTIVAFAILLSCEAKELNRVVRDYPYLYGTKTYISARNLHIRNIVLLSFIELTAIASFGYCVYLQFRVPVTATVEEYRLARQEKKRAALEEKQKSIQDELDRMK